MTVDPERQWQCEGCGKMFDHEPEHVESHTGYEGEIIELYWCDDCTIEPYF